MPFAEYLKHLGGQLRSPCVVTVRESEGEQGSTVCTCDSSSGEAEAGGSSVSVDKLLFHVRVREHSACV